MHVCLFYLRHKLYATQGSIYFTMICNFLPAHVPGFSSSCSGGARGRADTHTHTNTHSSLHKSCGTLLHFESLSVFLSRVRGSRQDHLLLVQIAVTEAVRRQVLRVCCRAALVYVSARVLWHGGRVHLLGSALAKPRFAGSFV